MKITTFRIKMAVSSLLNRPLSVSSVLSAADWFDKRWNFTEREGK